MYESQIDQYNKLWENRKTEVLSESPRNPTEAPGRVRWTYLEQSQKEKETYAYETLKIDRK